MKSHTKLVIFTVAKEVYAAVSFDRQGQRFLLKPYGSRHQHHVFSDGCLMHRSQFSMLGFYCTAGVDRVRSMKNIMPAKEQYRSGLVLRK